ncbi:MAG: MATE family efflux transporter [Candidatus Omnitrophica bacterium]|nr:MATE family efflux transporter [Candidatus Omnitrophota bacterium]
MIGEFKDLLRKLKDKKIRAIIAESWSVSWPMALIMCFIFFIGLADVYVAGKFGKEVQAAYGVAFQLYFIFSIIANALTVGTVSVVSRLFTSHRKKEFNTAVDSSILSGIATGSGFGIVGVLSCGVIINLLGIPDILKSLSIPLVRIYSAGLLFNYLLISTNGILRACKMIKKSLITMAVVCVLNIVLNFTFALHTPMKFQGIAVATLVSIFIGMLMNIAFVRKLLSPRITFSWETVKKIFNIGWPAGLLQILWQFGAMVLYLILARLPAHNVEIMAAFTNGLRIESAIFLPAFAFNLANAVVVGNLLGRGERDDAYRGGMITAYMGFFTVTALTVLVMLNAFAVASFLSDNPIVVNECAKYIFISLIVEPLMAWGVILSGGLNGAGDTRSVMKIMTLSVWCVRIPLSYLLALRFGFGAIAVWWSMNASIIVQTFFVSRHYFRKGWLRRTEKVIVPVEVK